MISCRITHLAQDFRIANDDDTESRPSHGNVQPPRVVQEPNALVLVGPDARENDEVLLPPLEGVHAGHLDLLVHLHVQRALVLHVVDDVRALALVRRDDADLLGLDAALEELGRDLLHVGRLGSVEVGRA